VEWWREKPAAAGGNGQRSGALRSAASGPARPCTCREAEHHILWHPEHTCTRSRGQGRNCSTSRKSTRGPHLRPSGSRSGLRTPVRRPPSDHTIWYPRRRRGCGAARGGDRRLAAGGEAVERGTRGGAWEGPVVRKVETGGREAGGESGDRHLVLLHLVDLDCHGALAETQCPAALRSKRSQARPDRRLRWASRTQRPGGDRYLNDCPRTCSRSFNW
jgi:hypothetical protein